MYHPDHIGFSFTGEELLDALPGEVVVIDRTGVVQYVNREYSERLGRSAEELTGHPLAEPGESDSFLRIAQAERETRLQFQKDRCLNLLSNFFRDGKPAGAVRIQLREENLFLPPGEQDDGEKNYSHMRQDIHTLFTSNWDVIYASDRNGITLEVSSAAGEIWGVEADELIGRTVYELEKERVFYPSITRMVLETGQRVQAIQETASGKRLLVLGTPVKDADGNILRVINTSRLIVSENELRTELETARRLIEAYRHELREMRLNEQENTPFIAQSRQMKRVVSLADKVAETDITVLITGESGSGKEVLANYIQSRSARKNRPYIKINCGAIPGNLLESELFGYERGAFTGAEKGGKAGIFELANNGTLFLDEIGEIPLPLQVKLLRVLQENELMRVGGTKTIPVDVRILAATNKDLAAEVQKGTFRKDLYYRLCVVPIHLPPLRERAEDIVPLSMSFLRHCNEKYGFNKTLSPAIIDCFLNAGWEGNIRELQNTIERLVVLAPDDVIDTDLLPDFFIREPDSDVIEVREIIPLREAQELVEAQLLKMARKKYRTTTRIAEALGVNQSTISRKLKDRES